MHKFPVHELEDLANWLRKIINEPAGGVQVPTGAELGLMAQPMSIRPPSPSSEDKRKRKSMS